MNIPHEEKALKSLPPQKYTIRILVIAVCSLFSGYPVMWKIMNSQKDSVTLELKNCNENHRIYIERKQEEAQKYDRDRAERSEVDRRRSDSILMITILTQKAVKKAIKNENK